MYNNLRIKRCDSTFFDYVKILKSEIQSERESLNRLTSLLKKLLKRKKGN